jgi:hypothetical protein
MKASEFKFLAWYKSERRFVKGSDLQDATNLPVTPTKQGFKLKSKFEFFMFTGCQDSNKKDIYDGHVLEVKFHNPMLKDSNFTVRWVFGGFMVDDFINDEGEECLMPLGFAIQNWHCDGATYEIIDHIKTMKK